MSTRSIIRLKQFDRVVDLYHHCDGYPEGVGMRLLDNIEHWFSGRPSDHIIDAGEFATYLIKNKQLELGSNRKPRHDDDGYQVTVFTHWDAEYLYELDFGKDDGLTMRQCLQGLKCYELKMHFDDGFEGYDKRKSINLINLRAKLREDEKKKGGDE